MRQGGRHVLRPSRFGATLDAGLRAAIEDGRHLSMVFHPFLAERQERFDVIRGQLAAVRRLVDDGVLWCVPYRDVAAWIRAAVGEGPFEALALDATVA